MYWTVRRRPRARVRAVGATRVRAMIELEVMDMNEYGMNWYGMNWYDINGYDMNEYEWRRRPIFI